MRDTTHLMRDYTLDDRHNTLDDRHNTLDDRQHTITRITQQLGDILNASDSRNDIPDCACGQCFVTLMWNVTVGKMWVFKCS